MDFADRLPRGKRLVESALESMVRAPCGMPQVSVRIKALRTAAENLKLSGAFRFRNAPHLFYLYPVNLLQFLAGRDPHPVEGTVDEDQRDEEEDHGHAEFQAGVLHRYGDLHGEQAEERRELDHRIQGDRRGILERVAHGVADDRRLVQRGVLLLQVHLDDLLGVIPAAAGIGHENRLEEAEEGDGDEITDEEVGVEEGEPQGHEEDHDEDVDHPLLGIDRTDLDDLLAVLDGGFILVQFDMILDVDDRLIGTRHDGLDGGAGEPVDHAAAHEQAQDDLRLDEAQFRDHVSEETLQQDDDPENHRRRADDGGADEDRFGGGLEGVAAAVGGLQIVFRLFEIRFDAEVLS